jgi:methionine synthase II (cobalamin-independent)
MQVASEKDKEQVYKLCGKYSREDADGVAQICFVGVTNPLHRQVETPQQVRCDLLMAARHIPKERLGSTDDCGFSPFSIDLKPKHGSPDLAREIAFKKIAARVEGTAMASEKLGMA